MTDVMRREYRVLSDDEKDQLDQIKKLGETFWHTLDTLGSSREFSLAKTKIEEAVMWATKGIAS